VALQTRCEYACQLVQRKELAFALKSLRELVAVSEEKEQMRRPEDVPMPARLALEAVWELKRPMLLRLAPEQQIW
jgi:hypothetical protein